MCRRLSHDHAQHVPSLDRQAPDANASSCPLEKAKRSHVITKEARRAEGTHAMASSTRHNNLGFRSFSTRNAFWKNSSRRANQLIWTGPLTHRTALHDRYPTQEALTLTTTGPPFSLRRTAPRPRRPMGTASYYMPWVIFPRGLHRQYGIQAPCLMLWICMTHSPLTRTSWDMFKSAQPGRHHRRGARGCA